MRRIHLCLPLSVNTANLMFHQGEQGDIKVKSEAVGPGFFELLEVPRITR